jgi:prolyl oligopeptidase
LYPQNLIYPETRKSITVDTIFDTPVTDEYRWLEDIYSQKVNEWVDAQNKVTHDYLKIAARKENSYLSIDKYAYAYYHSPKKLGAYYFTYAYHDNVSNPALYYQSTMSQDPVMLIDPAFISKSDNIILKDLSLSIDSKYLAFQFSRNGSDFGEARIINMEKLTQLEDHINNIKFSTIEWRGEGFYYSRFPRQGISSTSGQELYYHKLGTRQQDDELVFKRKGHVIFDAFTTTDERFLIISENNLDKGIYNVFIVDFDSENPHLMPLVMRQKYSLNIIGNRNGMIIALSFMNANNGCVVAIDPSNPYKWKELIPEYEKQLLLNVKLLDDRMLVIHQSNGIQHLSAYDYQGKILHSISFPFGLSISNIYGQADDDQLLLTCAGYIVPYLGYFLDPKTLELKNYGATTTNHDYNWFDTKQLEFHSKDGTLVPLTILFKKGMVQDGSNPLLLSAYGGFGAVETPSFDPGIIHFLLKGGIYAFANIRGGGDFGVKWAKKGRGRYKQNSFDDFIAAAEYLIDSSYTNPEKLAITGASNGGLVVAVAMTQRPELFKVAVPVVAPLDMIRFQKFTVGNFHIFEYGSISDTAGFHRLLNYSPLHNIKQKVNYPSTLILTSDNDERVPPLHSYKFAACLQNREAQKNPVLLRIEQRAGHYGAEGNLKRRLLEEADIYDFILYNLNR